MEHTSHRDVLGFIWTYLRRHLPAIGGMLVLLLLSTGLTLAQPFFYRGAIDRIVGSAPGDKEALAAAMMMVVLGILSAALALSFHELAAFLLGKVEVRIMRTVHADVFDHVQRLSTKFHVNAFAGATARKIGRGVDGIEGVIDRVWFNFLPLSVFTIGLTIVLTLFAPVIGLVMIAGILIYGAISIALNVLLSRFFRWTDHQDTKVTASLVDALTGNALVKAFGAEDRENLRHGSVLQEWERRQRTSWRVSNLVTWIQFMLLLLIELLVLLLAIELWFRGRFTPGGFVVMMFYVGQLWGHLHDIGRNLRDYLKSVSNCEEMVAMARQHVEVEDAPRAFPLAVRRGEISMEQITFRYENQHTPVFEDFSLSIGGGEHVALVGHSGGGKSTLVKLLLRLYDLDQGRIAIDGQDIREVSLQSLRSSLSLVPQDPLLFHRTIAENIAYGHPEATQEEIEHAARLAHASGFIEELPKGYETLVGERGVKLSGGERQRVAIARAILADKPILLLDEATSSLDSVSEMHIQKALENLLRNRTALIIAHRLSTVRSVDRIAVIAKGKLLCCAPHEELMKTCTVYKEMVDLQSGGLLAE